MKHLWHQHRTRRAGGLDDLLLVRSLGVSRIGATTTAAMLDDAKARGIGETPVPMESVSAKLTPGAY